EMLDGGRHQLGLGGEMVELGAPGDAGPLRDLGGGGTGVAELVQALDGRVEQPGPGRGAALLLSPADRSCGDGHGPHTYVTRNKQSSLNVSVRKNPPEESEFRRDVE